jgi:serine/threonine protein kinase
MVKQFVFKRNENKYIAFRKRCPSLEMVIRKRFKNEASLMAHLQHPNIVGLKECSHNVKKLN